MFRLMVSLLILVAKGKRKRGGEEGKEPKREEERFNSYRNNVLFDGISLLILVDKGREGEEERRIKSQRGRRRGLKKRILVPYLLPLEYEGKEGKEGRDKEQGRKGSEVEGNTHSICS
jgi:hypothetical protein